VYFSAGIVQLNVNNSEYPTLCLQQLDSRFYNVMSVNYLQCVLWLTLSEWCPYKYTTLLETPLTKTDMWV